MYREQYGEYAYWVLGVKGEKWKTNKWQQRNKDSVMCTVIKGEFNTALLCY